MQGPTDSHMLTVKDRTRPRLSGSMSTTCSSHGCPSGVATARPTCDHLSGCHPGLSSRAIPHTIVRLATCRIKPAWTKLSTNSKTDHADRITETAEPQMPCRFSPATKHSQRLGRRTAPLLCQERGFFM